MSRLQKALEQLSCPRTGSRAIAPYRKPRRPHIRGSRVEQFRDGDRVVRLRQCGTDLRGFSSDSGAIRGFVASKYSCNPVKVTRPELRIEGGILRA